MKAKTDKSHVLSPGEIHLTATIDGNSILSEKLLLNAQVLLGVTIDSNLSFDSQITNLCKTATIKTKTFGLFMDFCQKIYSPQVKKCSIEQLASNNWPSGLTT